MAYKTSDSLHCQKQSRGGGAEKPAKPPERSDFRIIRHAFRKTDKFGISR